jgi:hypothetical protein
LNNNDFLYFSFCPFSISAIILAHPFYGGKKNNLGKKISGKGFLGDLGAINFKKDFENCCQKMEVRTRSFGGCEKSHAF